MGLFKSKQQKELEKKMLIKRTISSMNKQINVLEEQKKVFLEKAKVAKKNGLESQVNLAITGYKMTAQQQKRAKEMLLNFEITSQMKDMTVMTKEFLGGMSVLSKEMAKLSDEKEFLKVQKQFEIAMGKAEQQATQMDLFMESSQDSFSSAYVSSSEDDAELKSLIDGEASLGDASDDDIDKELDELRKKMDQNI